MSTTVSRVSFVLNIKVGCVTRTSAATMAISTVLMEQLLTVQKGGHVLPEGIQLFGCLEQQICIGVTYSRGKREHLLLSVRAQSQSLSSMIVDMAQPSRCSIYMLRHQEVLAEIQCEEWT